ncbi:uncharacterized protein TNCV_3396831 [Trichonephila clavipes]|nr:uncharacterized protein TNCV_3396831 [Trichonephila clavipes]
MPLTPSHYHLRRQWCQFRAHWRTEWRSVLFSDESRLCLGASDGHMLDRKRSGKRMQPNCLRLEHSGPTPEVIVFGTISYDRKSIRVVIPNTLTANLYVYLVIQPIVLPIVNSFQGEMFRQDNAYFDTTVVTQRSL